MLSVVNQRMENFDARAKAETEAILSVMAGNLSNGNTNGSTVKFAAIETASIEMAAVTEKKEIAVLKESTETNGVNAPTESAEKELADVDGVNAKSSTETIEKLSAEENGIEKSATSPAPVSDDARYFVTYKMHR